MKKYTDYPGRKTTETNFDTISEVNPPSSSKVPILLDDWDSLLSECAELNQSLESIGSNELTPGIALCYPEHSNSSDIGFTKTGKPIYAKSTGYHEKDAEYLHHHQQSLFGSKRNSPGYLRRDEQMQRDFSLPAHATQDTSNLSEIYPMEYTGSYDLPSYKLSRFDGIDQSVGSVNFSDSNGSQTPSILCSLNEPNVKHQTVRRTQLTHHTMDTPTVKEYWVSETPDEEQDVWTVGSITDQLPTQIYDPLTRSQLLSPPCAAPALFAEADPDSEGSNRSAAAGIISQPGMCHQRIGGQMTRTVRHNLPSVSVTQRKIKPSMAPATDSLMAASNVEFKTPIMTKCVRWVEKPNTTTRTAQSAVCYTSPDRWGAGGPAQTGRHLPHIPKPMEATVNPVLTCIQPKQSTAIVATGKSDVGDCWYIHQSPMPVDRSSEHPRTTRAKANRFVKTTSPMTTSPERPVQRRISYEDKQTVRNSTRRKTSRHTRRKSAVEYYTNNKQSFLTDSGINRVEQFDEKRTLRNIVPAQRKKSVRETARISRLTQCETEALIQVIESLRNSIELSNIRLDAELNAFESMNSLRLRQPAITMSMDLGHRTSLAANRSTRTRFPKHDIVRRSACHRRIDEPGQNRTDKVSVEVRVVFLKIGEIDTLKEYYYADAFIQAKWREPKLDGKTVDELTVTELEQFWNPQIYIDNILSETKETQWLVAQKNEAGEMYLVERRRIKGVFLETLELNDFPLDVQDLTITVTTERPETEVDIIPDQSEMSAINIQTFVDQQEWKLHEHVEVTKRIMKQEYSSSMKNHAGLSVTCRAARRPGYFYWNVFLIMFMISSLSFATFAVSPDKAELRLRLSFTLILTSVTFKYVITQSLPKISYLTYMDKYVLMSLGILCIISVWHAVVTLFDPDHIAMRTGQYGTSSEERSSEGDHGFLQINENDTMWGMNKTNNSVSTRSTLSNSSHDLSHAELASHLFLMDHDTEEGWRTANGGLELNDTSVVVSEECSLNNKMACEEWRHVQAVEQHVFVSFVIIYVIAHAVFIFWLYFDASRRRREMRQKDKEYRKQKRKSRG